MKTKEELNALKEEVKTVKEKLSALTEEELEQVTGGSGGDHPPVLIHHRTSGLTTIPGHDASIE